MRRSTLLISCLALSAVPGCGRILFDPLSLGGGDDAKRADDAAIIDASLPAGLVLWLPMDDGIADRISSDASGNGNDAACVSAQSCPAEVAGRSGLALGGFSNAAPGLEIADAPTWRFATSFTLAAWVRVIALGGGYAVISKPLVGPTQNSYQLEIVPAGQLTCHANPGGGLTRVIATTTFPVGTWTHVACTYDGTLRLYIDGLLVDGPSTAVAPGYDAQSLYIGSDRNGGTTSGNFNGDIDDVRIYNITLSAPEIAAIAQ